MSLTCACFYYSTSPVFSAFLQNLHKKSLNFPARVLDSSGKFLSFWPYKIGHLRDGLLLLLRPESFSFLLSYLNLVIPARFTKQNQLFAQESKTLKDSGRRVNDVIVQMAYYRLTKWIAIGFFKNESCIQFFKFIYVIVNGETFVHHYAVMGWQQRLLAVQNKMH